VRCLRTPWAQCLPGRDEDSRARPWVALLHRILLGRDLLPGQPAADLHGGKTDNLGIAVRGTGMAGHELRCHSTVRGPPVADVDQGVRYYRPHRSPFSGRVTDSVGRLAVGPGEAASEERTIRPLILSDRC